MGKFSVFVSFWFVVIFGIPNHASSEIELENIGQPESLDEILKELNLTELSVAIRADHPHMNVNVIELIEMYEYSAETHKVETKDGHILEMHRIIGPKENPSAHGKPAVLLQHGLLSSSMDWIIAGPGRGLGFVLADAGYDVWMGNARGTKYSRGHKNMKDTDAKYWDFSWHEIGVIDLPAKIDYILSVTGRKKIFYAGHSQGTTSFFVMTSELPEYNDKINAMFALAPIGYCSKMFSPIFQTLAKVVKPIHNILKLIGVNEFKPTDNFFKKFTTKFCSQNSIIQPLCRNVLFMIAGFNKAQMDMELLPAILSHIPAGASVQQVVHYAQLIKSGYFRQYDHGLMKNIAKYGKASPPDYKIKNIRAPVLLHYSTNDWLAHINDVNKLYSQLPNPIGKLRVPDSKFNHLDYIWAKDAKTLVYDKMISVMKKYRD